MLHAAGAGRKHFYHQLFQVEPDRAAGPEKLKAVAVEESSLFEFKVPPGRNHAQPDSGEETPTVECRITVLKHKTKQRRIQSRLPP